jgi:hypothetical protein
MSLMFGDLTISFVNFGKAVQAAFIDESGANQQALNEAANKFRQSAAKDASYLVYIGTYYIS